MAELTCRVNPAVFRSGKKLFALLRPYFAAQVRQRGPQILVRIDRRVANADLVVQVRACGAAAVPDVADHLAADYGLACNHSKAGHMSVDGFNAAAVVDDHLAAVTVGHLGFLHCAVACSADGNAVGRGDIDAAVELAFAVTQNRVLALAEATGDWSHDRPECRNICRSFRTPNAACSKQAR